MTTHRSPLPDVEIPQVALTDHVLGKHVGNPDVAVIDARSHRELTYGELSSRVRRLAGGLVTLGVRPGDILAIAAPNSAEFIECFHAVLTCGATVTPINPAYGPHEITTQLLDAGARVLIAELPENVVNSVRATVTLDHIVAVADLDDHLGDPLDDPTPVETTTIAALPYSSGTTGLPKGVMLTHRNMVANLAQCAPMLDYASGERGLAALPFFHIYGMQVLMNGLLEQGATIVTMPRFNLTDALGLIERHRITQLFAVPPIVLALATAPEVDEYDLTSLRRVISGAAPLSADIAQQAAARIGCPIVQGYGMTELSPITHLTRPAHDQPGSAGEAVPNTECRIIDADGVDVSPGMTGELLIRGPQVMAGYLNNEEATAAMIDTDGWLHTGDIARITPSGHLIIVDRAKELIKVSGFQVPPAELESHLLDHPAVADAAVIARPDDRTGERPVAFVVVHRSSPISDGELLRQINERLVTYKRIDAIFFVDAIPRSPSGKTLRRELRAHLTDAQATRTNP